MLVSARQKPVDQLPEWALCCDTMREKHSSKESLVSIVKVEVGAAFLASAECKYCGKITHNRLFTKEISDRAGHAIALDLFDLDEGA